MFGSESSGALQPARARTPVEGVPDLSLRLGGDDAVQLERVVAHEPTAFGKPFGNARRPRLQMPAGIVPGQALPHSRRTVSKPFWLWEISTTLPSGSLRAQM